MNLTYPIHAECLPDSILEAGHYRARYARTEKDLEQIFRIRYEIFNLELDEGLEESHETGLDQDEYDPSCHHLIVEDARNSDVVGTYRMQTGGMADEHFGFYSANEFDLSQLDNGFVSNAVELGRACVLKEHRNRRVLYLLWKGIVQYLLHNRKRYFFGCCSLTSQDPSEGKRVLDFLHQRNWIHPHFNVNPLPGLECFDRNFHADTEMPVILPRLMQLYINYGARMCNGIPAIDRKFKTIDFLAIFDEKDADEHTRKLFFE